MSLHDDNLEDLVPGAQLTHLLTIVADDALKGLRTIIENLDRQGATLHAVNVGRLEDRSVQRIRLGGIKVEAARTFARQLAALPGIASARIEHVISRETL